MRSHPDVEALRHTSTLGEPSIVSHRFTIHSGQLHGALFDAAPRQNGVGCPQRPEFSLAKAATESKQSCRTTKWPIDVAAEGSDCPLRLLKFLGPGSQLKAGLLNSITLHKNHKMFATAGSPSSLDSAEKLSSLVSGGKRSSLP